ncbi:MAG: hypothetical protein RMY34_35710 [Aulosira sp. DedQUE10]|nr:hypothetical protein [Aulosira sp. DedQUE10]
METYHQLTNSSADVEILTGLSEDKLQALAESILSPKAQTQLNDLLVRNQQNQLSSDKIAILDKLLAQVDQLNLLKTRAYQVLHQY